VIENAFSGIVLTAQTFNPSIFTETWLAQNSLIAPDALTGLRIFSPEVAQFQTSDVQIQVVPPRMQITFKVHDLEGDFEQPLHIAARVVELLPHTPYQSLGMNFDYFVTPPEGQEFDAYDRELLGDGGCALLGEFASGDPKFGRYFSKQYGDARMKLDVKPVKAGAEQRDLLRLSFNFHHAVGHLELSDRPAMLVRFIGTWAALRGYAEKLVELTGTL